MNTHADKTKENKSQTVTAEASRMQSGGESTFQFVDSRPEAIQTQQLQELANNSAQVSGIAQLQAMADSFTTQKQPIQRKENNTGLPDNLKTGMENLSGMSLDDVKVHRNSDKPAQLHAHAYAQGTDIHLGAGQEKHLPHEAWHVVQQKQGRVKPTMQMKGKVNVNDDAGLEKEADVMGAKALLVNESIQNKSMTKGPQLGGTVQRKLSPLTAHVDSRPKKKKKDETYSQDFSGKESARKIQELISSYNQLSHKDSDDKLNYLNKINKKTAKWQENNLTMQSDDLGWAIYEELETISGQIPEEIAKNKAIKLTYELQEDQDEGINAPLLGESEDSSSQFTVTSEFQSSVVVDQIKAIDEEKIKHGFSAIAEAQGKFDFHGKTKHTKSEGQAQMTAKAWVDGLLEVQKLDGALGLLANLEAGMESALDAEGQAELNIGEIKAEVKAKLNAITKIGGILNVEAEVGKNGFKIGGKVAATAAAEAKGSLSGKLTFRGVEIFSGEAAGEAMAGAEASASGSIEITRDGIVLAGEAGAFAGLSAKVSAGLSVAGDRLKVGASAAVQVGVGAKLAGSFELKNNKLVISGELALALGLGGALGFNIEIDLNDGLEKAWDYLANQIASKTYNKLKEIAEKDKDPETEPLLPR
jgi:hypothetical protein